VSSFRAPPLFSPLIRGTLGLIPFLSVGSFVLRLLPPIRCPKVPCPCHPTGWYLPHLLLSPEGYFMPFWRGPRVSPWFEHEAPVWTIRSLYPLLVACFPLFWPSPSFRPSMRSAKYFSVLMLSRHTLFPFSRPFFFRSLPRFLPILHSTFPDFAVFCHPLSLLGTDTPPPLRLSFHRLPSFRAFR